MTTHLTDPRFGRVLVNVLCDACGNRTVGVVQAEGFTQDAAGHVRRAPILRGQFGRTPGGAAVTETLLTPGKTPRVLVCRRHGSREVDIDALLAAASNPGARPRIVRTSATSEL